METLKYKGYTGSVCYSDANEAYFGMVTNCPALICYAGATKEELEANFRSQLDQHLTMQAFLRASANKALGMTAEDLIWLPLHPNGMEENPQCGFFCLILTRQEDGLYSGRRYSIVYQHRELFPGSGLTNDEVEFYLLYERSLWNVDAPQSMLDPEEANEWGKFVWAYTDLGTAKERALNQYKAIFSYAMSHLLTEEEPT